jgi:hypothetical protein
MRNLCENTLSGADNLAVNGEQIDANQLVSASFHAYFGDAHAAGTFKLQASNDECTFGNLAANFLVTNWIDIPNQTSAVSAGTSALLTVGQMTYRWIRAVWTPSYNYKQVSTVDTVADLLGSLNNTYFTLTSIHPVGVQKNFYVWFDDGAGVDPALPGATGIQVVYADNDSANTLATLVRAALNALTLDFVATGATNHVIITNVNPGAVPAAADGTAATGFTFANTTAGNDPTTINVNINALSL